jgi:hypothetical protein
MDPHLDSSQFRLAYLITVRSFGTWLHGDETRNRSSLNAEPCHAIEEAIKEVCNHRGYHLWAVNAERITHTLSSQLDRSPSQSPTRSKAIQLEN